MSRRALSLAVRAFILVLGGLVSVVLMSLAGSFAGGGAAHASVASSCSTTSGAASITLGDGITTLSISGGNLQVSDGSASSCGTASSITSISFAVGTGAVPTQVIFDETGGILPCAPLSGSLGTVPLQVTAVTGASPVVFGTSGVSVALCSQTDTLGGASSYSVVLTGSGSSTGPLTVSAAGGSGTGNPTSATLNAPANTGPTTYTLGANVSFPTSAAGSYTIALSGTGDTVSAVTGSSTFTFSGAHPVGFTGVSGGTYTISGLAASSQITAGSGTESYTLSSSGGALGFSGASGGTYTLSGLPASSQVSGGTGSESYTFNSSGGALSFSGASGGTYTLINLPASSQVTGGSGTESFTFTTPGGALTFTGTSGGTYTINGLPNSSQVTAGAGTESFTINGNSLTGLTLTSGSGNATFTLPGTGNSNNTLQGGTGTGSFTLTGDNITYHGATGADTVTITGNSNNFIVGSGPETFYDTDSVVPPSNTIDFGAVGASPAAQLFVNDSGSSQNAGGSTLASGQATLSGSGVTYTFRDSPTAATSANFTTIRGASGGSTDFLAGGTGGTTLIGQGVGNSASFFGTNGIVANVSGALQITNAQLSQSAVPLSGFQIGSGQVLVSSPGASTSCSGTPIAPFCDVLTDVFNITGPSGGFSTFYAGATIPSGDTYKFSDAGDFNTFIGGTGPATFSSAGNHNTFVAGFGNETFTETTTSQVPSNTIDFSNVPTGQQAGCTGGPCILTINISGAGATVPNFVAELINSAPAALATYTFGGSGGGADFTIFIGAAGGNTTFLGGSGNYTYTGGGTGNSLDFSNLSGISSLTFDVTHTPLPQVQVGAVPETFSGITDLIGLTTGSTTFIGGSTGGYTFDGKGTGNQVVFTSQGPSTTLSVTVTQGGPAVTGGTVTFTIAGGQVLCSAVPVSSAGVASCYPTSLPAGQVQIVAVYTPPPGVTFTGSGFVLTVNNAGGPTATTTDTVQAIPTAGPVLFEGQSVTLSATVSSTGGSVNSGSVSFFLAGSNTVLCTYTLPATSCVTPSLPAGNYVLLAVYTPGSGFSGSAGTTLISVNSPPASTLSNFTYTGGSSFSVDYNVPGGSTGEICITSLDSVFGDISCTLVNNSGTAFLTLSFFSVSKNDQFFAQLTYFSGPTPFSGSSVVVGPLTTAPDIFGFSPTGAAISASVNGVSVSTTTAGTTVNFTITVTAPGHNVPSGGFLTVELVGGATICSSVPVPGGAASATIFCSASLPAGTDNILAFYTPPCCTFTGSASVVVLTVNGPTSETSTVGVAPTQDLSPGVVANLSNSTYCTNGTNPCVGGISVPGGDVLVASPQSGVSSCSTTGTPLQTFCDSLVDIAVVTGSSGGHNTFVAGSGSETLADTGSAGGDTIDFSKVPTGSSSSTLTVNVTGGNGSFTATVAGGGPTYTFTTGGSNFTTFVGSSQGFTTFLAGPNPGYSFTASGSGNVIDFSAATSGVLVNLSGSTQQLVAPGNVRIGAGTDTISGLSTVIGSSAGGNTFYGGSTAPSYSFTGIGTGNTFVAGTSPDTFNDPSAGNTVDFSQLTGLNVVVDRSSTTVSPTAPNSASTFNGFTFTGSTYTFGASATTFIGAPAGATFYAGSATDTFNGFAGALASNKLIFQFAPQPSLTICLVTFGSCSAGQAQLSGVKQVAFSNISTFIGLAAGNTTFMAGDNGGKTFTGLGTGNTADFSAALNPITADLASQTNTVTVSSGPADVISGISTIFGSCHGGNDFIAGTTSETFGDIGNTGVAPCNLTLTPDQINFSSITGTTSNSVLTINASGKQDVLSPFTATFGSATWTFSTGGANFKTFTGAASGNTVFLASGTTTGFSFSGLGPNNTLNLATNTAGVSVDMVSGIATLTGRTATPPTCTPGCDTFLGITTVVGSPTGSNSFYGGLLGNTFTAQSSDNTLSYVELAGPVTVDLTTSTVSGVDTFSFPFGSLTIQGSQGNDTFVASSRAVILQGGGGSDTLNLSHLANGVVANLNTGSITSSGIGGITFAPCTSSPTASQLCLASVLGTAANDSFIAAGNSLDTGPPVLNIAGGGGTDSLDLSNVSQSATIVMSPGSVTGNASHKKGITFSGIANLFGTQFGGDYVFAGPGTANIFENGSTATMDFSTVGGPGVTVTVATTSGSPTGTTTNSLNSINYSFTGFSNLIGTSSSDTFVQNGPGSFNFFGLGGNNTLTLNGLPSGVVVSLTPDGSCASGNSDGTAVLSGSVNDQFVCMFQVSSGGTLVFIVTPGETTTVNGGGNGTLELLGTPTGGAIINLGTGQVSGGGYDFSFSGMSIIDGTPFADVFIAGPGSFTLNGMGGNDTISFVGAPSAVVVNDSSTSYTIPSGYSNSGIVVPAHSTLGGYGGVIRLNLIYNLVASATNTDILVADNTHYGSLTGGAGNDRFVLTGADNYLYAGTGNATLDLSLLPGQTSLDLAVSSLQPLGTGAGFLTLAGGNITTVIASPGGSSIWGGNGSLTLTGGSGSDWLAGGTGNQTITGGGGSDTLVGGVGSDTLTGGTSPVTFVPGQGTDTLTSSTTGNTLSYSGAPSAVNVNLSSNLFSVPAGEPFAGTTISPLTATGGWGATVNLAGAGISVVSGSGRADIFVTGSNDTIFGNGGADLFVITGSSNTLTAGINSGSRFFFFGPSGATISNNVLNGGGNSTVDFSQAPSGVNVNLQTGAATGGWGGFQKIAGVLNIIGSQFNDVLVAGGPGGTIIGLNGNDLLIAGPSGGDTLISNGSGNDTFCAQSSCASGNATGGGNTMIGGSGNDVFFTANGVPDIIDGGAGFNSAFTDPTEQSVTNIQQQTVG